MDKICFLQIVLEVTTNVIFGGIASFGILFGIVWKISASMNNKIRAKADKKFVSDELKLKTDDDVFQQHIENNNIQFESLRSSHKEHSTHLRDINKKTDDILKILAK